MVSQIFWVLTFYILHLVISSPLLNEALADNLAAFQFGNKVESSTNKRKSGLTVKHDSENHQHNSDDNHPHVHDQNKPHVHKDTSPDQKPSISEGKKIFVKHCQQCHTKGKIPEEYPDFWDEEDIRFFYRPIDYFNTISENDDQHRLNLTKQAYWDVSFYIKSLTTRKQSVQTGKNFFLLRCSPCHGNDGKKGKMNLTKPKFFLERSDEGIFTFLKEKHMHEKTVPVKNNKPIEASEDNIWSIVDFLRSFQYQN